MRSVVRIGLAAAVLGTMAGPAGADIPVYYHVGGWDAFSGPGADGRMVCGAGTTNPADNRSFSLRFTIGGDSVLFEAKKPNWNIPANAQIPVVVQIGLNSPWNVQGTGSGQTVEWSLDRTAMQTFDAQFRIAGSMTLSFPSGNEPPWTVGLNGSTAISNAFGRCVTDLTRRAALPAGAPAPTQPFGQAPTQPTAQEPTQPAPTQATETTQPTQPKP
jgi:hypothetical protein